MQRSTRNLLLGGLPVLVLAAACTNSPFYAMTSGAKATTVQCFKKDGRCDIKISAKDDCAQSIGIDPVDNVEAYGADLQIRWQIVGGKVKFDPSKGIEFANPGNQFANDPSDPPGDKHWTVIDKNNDGGTHSPYKYTVHLVRETGAVACDQDPTIANLGQVG